MSSTTRAAAVARKPPQHTISSMTALIMQPLSGISWQGFKAAIYYGCVILFIVGDSQAGTITPLPSPRGGDGEGGTSNGKDGGQPGASLEARSPASVTGEDREATHIHVTRTCLAGNDVFWRHGI